MASGPDDIDRVIAEQTSWLATGAVSAALAKPRERPLATTLWLLLLPSVDRPRRFRLILGPRRVGKTTVMYQTVRYPLNDAGLPPERLVWARLDHPRLMPLSLDGLVRRRGELAGATPDASSSFPTLPAGRPILRSRRRPIVTRVPRLVLYACPGIGRLGKPPPRLAPVR